MTSCLQYCHSFEVFVIFFPYHPALLLVSLISGPPGGFDFAIVTIHAHSTGCCEFCATLSKLHVPHANIIHVRLNEPTQTFVLLVSNFFAFVLLYFIMAQVLKRIEHLSYLLILTVLCALSF